MKKEIKQIFFALALFSLASGFFYNFEELWLQENNLSLSTIGTIISLASIISISVIYLSTSIVNMKKIKVFTCSLILIKAIMLLLLYFLNGSGHNIIIKFLIMVEYAIDSEIYACIYPLITFVTKDDKLYAKEGLIYDGMYYVAVVLVGILLGKRVGFYTINYNSYVLIASIFMFLALFILLKTNVEKYVKKETKNEYGVFSKFLKKIRKDKISIYYFLFVVFGDISYYAIMGLSVLILTGKLDFSPIYASNFILFMGIAAVIIGIIVLNKLTFKNNYLNLSIKYIGRAILYLIAFLFTNKIIILITILYCRLLSSSYSHITNAPYINRFNNKDQIIFSNLNEMLSYLGRAIGIYICGVCIEISLRYNFLWALIFIIFQIIFGFKALNLRMIESKEL